MTNSTCCHMTKKKWEEIIDEIITTVYDQYDGYGPCAKESYDMVANDIKTYLEEQNVIRVIDN